DRRRDRRGDDGRRARGQPGAAAALPRRRAGGALIRRTLVFLALLVVVAGCGSSTPRQAALVFVSTRDGDYALYAVDAGGRGGWCPAPADTRPRRRRRGSRLVAGREADRLRLPPPRLFDPRDLGRAPGRPRSAAGDAARRGQRAAVVVARRRADRLPEQRPR